MYKIDSGTIMQIRSALNQKFPIGLVPRRMLSDATGGVLNPRTAANEDCLNKGIDDPVLVGKQVCYRVEKVVEYLEKKMSLKNYREAV